MMTAKRHSPNYQIDTIKDNTIEIWEDQDGNQICGVCGSLNKIEDGKCLVCGGTAENQAEINGEEDLDL